MRICSPSPSLPEARDARGGGPSGTPPLQLHYMEQELQGAAPPSLT